MWLVSFIVWPSRDVKIGGSGDITSETRPGLAALFQLDRELKTRSVKN
jgi:hypothetical protein